MELVGEGPMLGNKIPEENIVLDESVMTRARYQSVPSINEVYRREITERDWAQSTCDTLLELYVKL
jgi:hypothetical protein